MVAFVDDEDFERVNQFKWYASQGGKVFYAARRLPICEGGKIMLMHHFIIGKPDINTETDHWDHNTLNNQRLNLRPCTSMQNKMNFSKRLNTSSIFKGVCFYANLNKYRCRIKYNKKEINLGYFRTETEAAIRYNEMAINLFGEFALLNII